MAFRIGRRARRPGLGAARLFSGIALRLAAGLFGLVVGLLRGGEILGARFDESFDWGNPKNLGLFTCLSSSREGRDAGPVQQLRENLIATADAIVAVRNRHGYARPLGSRYSWGGNGGVVRQTMLLQAAHRIAPKPELIETALDAVRHLFGRNVHGPSYVTGIGALPPQHPHDRRVGGNGVAEAWPGHLVGGPNPQAADWHDVQADYRTNEIAINWNGALIFVLAGFLPPYDQ